ncbi:hypothetical protein ACFSY7_03150 [Kurthia populi]|uniref:Uncharacterized protein n=1 Tax=Kurthia populi TaxID=1562132 RepID=A0ABW5XWZ8_9BACL
MTKQERLEKINELLVVIASNGRKFLLNQKDGEVSKFVIKANNHVYYRDYYTKQELKGTKAMYKSYGFSGGGTLQALVMDFAEWIRTGDYTNGKNGYGGLFCPHWGYDDDSMQQVRDFAVKIGYLDAKQYS